MDTEQRALQTDLIRVKSHWNNLAEGASSLNEVIRNNINSFELRCPDQLKTHEVMKNNFIEEFIQNFGKYSTKNTPYCTIFHNIINNSYLSKY